MSPPRNSVMKAPPLSLGFLFTITVSTAIFQSHNLPAQEEVPLKFQDGVYHVPVRINNVITLDFIIDSGASDVTIPADVALTLVRAKTIDGTDFLPGAEYQLADGSIVSSPRFVIRELTIGSQKLMNVVASISNINGSLLLGQTALRRLDSWRFDYQKNKLVLGANPILDLSQVSDRGVDNFVRYFLTTADTRDISGLIQVYDDNVNYFGKGYVNKTFIIDDKKSYFKKWPISKTNIVGAIQIYQLSPSLFEAHFNTNFYASNSMKSSMGIANNILQIRKDQGRYRICSEKQMVLSRKRQGEGSAELPEERMEMGKVESQKTSLDRYRGIFYPSGCLTCDNFKVSPDLKSAEDCVRWGERLRTARKNSDDTWECGKNCSWKDGFSICESTFGMEGTGLHLGE